MSNIYNKNPRVFISYSWDDDNHKKWVNKFATELIKNGINVRIDQYDVDFGDSLPQFMETEITNADYVLIICTENYKTKADLRKNGVGYEGDIISGEILANHNKKKFIPVLRKGTVFSSIPTFLQGKLAIDLSSEKNYSTNFNDLITTLFDCKKKPKIGKIPKFILNKKEISHDNKTIKILGIITDEVTIPKLDGSAGSALYSIPFKLSSHPSELWKTLFIKNWNYPPKFTTMHRPNIATVSHDKIILNGTTIEEVQQYHRDTLILCIAKTNEDEKKFLETKKRKEERNKILTNNHYQNILNKAKEIKF
ncbi:hypothetical protein IX317_001523 [Fusobacterium sp. DD29]|uniref:toll/interleukin-1 receptor domain-containing protein n=1 Tax=unclassified Fusobacterium TaxID=2648384 RepID=UPI001B8D51E4|nr:hypothetical protein [Fusobacterium sp. DD45]MBR8711413.1 hypothetical protein [Fusobacterium sp. DD28]MBR8749844.1 hypothetical protein [Fusobacterium sp. DD29]MBR8751958.1 hypothetical protein [Fusobacterium sp. DD26]MBR8762086.1 hypothetical protein [Fusobacterium sp. DD25]MBR8768142.1 hypothetical protein [Fusobacterium sp. DD43]MBR8772164.1 hypothetical protein [Fusobacterium sp. DD40]MBR8776398.1 hypothetical protein [Fusobacterium sp. DD17]MBR8798680.1 hypothetical protein [Fusoba